LNQQEQMMKSMFKQVAAAVAGWMLLAPSVWADAGGCIAGTRGCTVPEPGSLALVGLAIAAVIVVAKRRK